MREVERLAGCAGTSGGTTAEDGRAAPDEEHVAALSVGGRVERHPLVVRGEDPPERRGAVVALVGRRQRTITRT